MGMSLLFVPVEYLSGKSRKPSLEFVESHTDNKTPYAHLFKFVHASSFHTNSKVKPLNFGVLSSAHE